MYICYIKGLNLIAQTIESFAVVIPLSRYVLGDVNFSDAEELTPCLVPINYVPEARGAQPRGTTLSQLRLYVELYSVAPAEIGRIGLEVA